MNGMQTITIEVDAEVAEFYHATSMQNRQKLSVLLNLKLRDVVRPRRNVIDVMDEMSQQAEANGLTPEILATLLED